jgi:hypothetical protein
VFIFQISSIEWVFSKWDNVKEPMLEFTYIHLLQMIDIVVSQTTLLMAWTPVT